MFFLKCLVRVKGTVILRGQGQGMHAKASPSNQNAVAGGDR